MAITAGDFTGDGVLDLAVVDQNTNGVSILEGNGQGGFVALPPISLGDRPVQYRPVRSSRETSQAVESSTWRS